MISASDVHHQAACPTIPKQFCLIHTKWQHFILTGQGTGSKVPHDKPKLLKMYYMRCYQSYQAKEMQERRK